MLRCSAFLMLAGTAACTYPATTTLPPPNPLSETYRALGQEPGWALTIDAKTIGYRGDYGETRIIAPKPEARTTFNGHRYETPQIVVDITHGRCNDVMSGHGYSDQVMVIAGGKTVRGCGGQRRTDWDN